MLKATIIWTRARTEQDQSARAMEFWLSYSHSQRHQASETIARAIADTDKTDPFVYRRVYSMLMNGVMCPHDYEYSGDALRKMIGHPPKPAKPQSKQQVKRAA